MKPTLERIARALCALDGLPENTQFEGRPMWESFLPKARFALEAIRTPTEAMSAAGASALRSFSVSPEDASEAWDAMIYTALNETNQTGANQ